MATELPVDAVVPERPEAGAPRAPSARPAHATSVRAEIQALRAAAVVLVVTYHLWPSLLPGGFIGVDVFFAISGFLITSLLLREAERSGKVSLAAFWARRARRILPAALVTVLFCAVATVVFVPLTYWPQFFAEMRASTAYVQNWHLAMAAVDYLASTNGPSPVEHFWSLSVEEQFYLVWPALIVAALGATRSQPMRVRRAAIGLVMAALTALSLAYSILHTAADPAAAYFVTPTRAWEFGVGGLLALAPHHERSAAGRSVLSWVGIAAIVLAAATYSSHTPFPGYTALLPVLGALAVMRAGTPALRWSPTPVLTLSPIQFLGDISYSVYLWHWPFIVLAPFVVKGATTETRITIVMLTILVAWLTKHLIEDPARSTAFLARRKARWTLSIAVAATVAVVAVTVSGTSYVQAQIRNDQLVTQRTLASHPRCFGAAARDPEHPGCTNPSLEFAVVPTPLQAEKGRNAPCTVIQELDLVRVCAFGTSPEKATATIALIGDSHASHWRAALQLAAKTKHWRGLSITHSGCPFSKAIADLVGPAQEQCARWNREVLQWLDRHPEVQTAFVVGHTGGKVVVPSGRSMFNTQVAGYRDAWNALPRSIHHVVVIRDTPKMHGDTLACVERAMSSHQRAGDRCGVARSTALEADPAQVAAARSRSDRAQAIDLTGFFCDRRRCPPVIGGALVYKDVSHLTDVYATTLGPFLLRDIDRLMTTWT